MKHNKKTFVHFHTVSYCLDFHGEEEIFSRLHQDRKYSTLQSHHFKNDSDYETIKQIHSNITTIVSTSHHQDFLPNHQHFHFIFLRANQDSSTMVLCLQGDASEEEEEEATRLWRPRITPSMPKWTKEESAEDNRLRETCSTPPRTPQLETRRETISQWRHPSSLARMVGPQLTLKNLDVMEWRGSSMMIERAECKTAKPITFILEYFSVDLSYLK